MSRGERQTSIDLICNWLIRSNEVRLVKASIQFKISLTGGVFLKISLWSAYRLCNVIHPAVICNGVNIMSHCWMTCPSCYHAALTLINLPLNAIDVNPCMTNTRSVLIYLHKTVCSVSTIQCDPTLYNSTIASCLLLH